MSFFHQLYLILEFSGNLIQEYLLMIWRILCSLMLLTAPGNDTDTQYIYEPLENYPTAADLNETDNTQPESNEVAADTSKEDHITSLFEILPFAEIQELIFEQLDLQTKINCRSVCKQWKRLVDGTLTFNILLSDETKDHVEKFGQSNNTVETLTIACLKTFQYPKNGIGFKKVCELMLCPANPNAAREAGGISHKNLQKLFAEFRDVEMLKFYSGSLEDIPRNSFLKDVKLNKVRFLELEGCSYSQPGFDNFGDILNNTFPSLELLYVCFHTGDDDMLESGIPPLYIQLYSFICRHRKSLQHLLIDNSNRDETNESLSGPLALDKLMPEKVFKLILEQLKEVKLSSLYFRASCFDGSSQFAKQLFQTQYKLFKIELKNIKNANIELWRMVPELLGKCSETLESIELFGSIISEPETQETFSCSIVANCTKLLLFRMAILGLEISDIEYLPKQITGLHLGYSLSSSQIDHICHTMSNLKALSLLQQSTILNEEEFNENSPKVDIPMFKKLLKMPQLEWLQIDKETSDHAEISNWIEKFGQGAVKIDNSLKDTETDNTLLVKIDRGRFDPTEILL